MTVAELIRVLQALPDQSAPVVCVSGPNDDVSAATGTQFLKVLKVPGIGGMYLLATSDLNAIDAIEIV